MGGDGEIAKEFIEKMKARKGVLPTKILRTEGFTTVIDEE